MFTRSLRLWLLCCGLLVAAALTVRAQIPHLSFEAGDVFVSIETGPVQWRLPDGTLRAVLVPRVSGTGEGMSFDAGGQLYVTRWRTSSMGSSGNTVEKFSSLGISQGASISGSFDCDPHTILFDTIGSVYVGQAGCRRSILKFASSGLVTAEYTPAQENAGIFWMDLAVGGCSMFYTSYGPNVKRFDVCANAQLPDFNLAPLPGGATQDLRVLPDGGVLVSSGDVIARLNSMGALVQTYQVAGEDALWAGLDLVGDGTFWVANYRTSNVYRFDLATGDTRAVFNTGTAVNTAVGVRVKK